MADEKCPDCQAPLVVRRLGASDWGPPIHHQQGGIDCVKRQNEQLRAIVDKLLKTHDGVPIVPGMKLWPCEPLGIYPDDPAEDYAVVVAAAQENGTGDILIHGDGADFSACCSTREAAAAAQETQP